MNKLWLVIGVFVISGSCVKDDIQIEEDLLLSEVIIGEWELQAEVDLMDYGDLEWHDLSPPFNQYQFTAEDTLRIVFGDGRLFRKTNYAIINQDSLIDMNAPGQEYREVEYFDQNRIEFFWQTREGRNGRRLIRKE